MNLEGEVNSFHGRTAEQWYEAWHLCATGRELEWEQTCKLTRVISRTAEGLKAAAANGNEHARRAYRKLNAITEYLWMCPAEKCEQTMPQAMEGKHNGNGNTTQNGA